MVCTYILLSHRNLKCLFSLQCPTHFVTGGSEGVDGVTVALLAACSAGDVPGVCSAAVAVLTDDVRLAGTLARVLITLTLISG